MARTSTLVHSSFTDGPGVPDRAPSPHAPATEAALDGFARLAAELFAAPSALVEVSGGGRRWIGTAATPGGTPCAAALCDHAMRSEAMTVVLDARTDPRFSDPAEPRADEVRFFAGAPLVGAGGRRLGTLAVMDSRPRPDLPAGDRARLAALAALVADRLDVQRADPAGVALRGFADSTADAMLCTDAQGVLTFVNKAALKLFGYAEAEMIGQTLNLIMPERFRDAHAAGVARIARGGTSKLEGRSVELSALRRGGEEFPIELGVCFWTAPDGLGMGASLRDISERKKRDLRLHRLAHHDPLTGLANRLQAENALAAAFAAGAPAALLLLDLNGFKDVNDGLGHAAGDALLQALAVRLTAALDADALLARMGSDEFAVVLPLSADPRRATACARTILAALNTPFRVLGHVLHLSVSIGVAIGTAAGGDAEELIASADLALYRAKVDGKRGYRVFEPAMRSSVAARRALQDELRRAVSEGELVLHYQPQLRLGSGHVVGAEALLRWQHPGRGLLFPDAFMPALERHALAAEVGRWVLEEACRQSAAWRQAGLPPLRMAVNLFAAQLRGGSLAATVAAALDRNGLAPADLELEITETIALQNDDHVLAALRDVRAGGVGLAFDDFGTGFASLSTLKRVPLTTLKIDRSFVRDLLDDEHDAAVVEAVVGMGRRLGLDVVAEGIETPEQEARLVELGCRTGQGFRYGRAVPAAAFAQRWAEADGFARAAVPSAA